MTESDPPPWWALAGLAEPRFSVVAVQVLAGGQEWRLSLVTAPWEWPCRLLAILLWTPILGPWLAEICGLPRQTRYLDVHIELCTCERVQR